MTKQLSICAWIYPKWARWSKIGIGLLNIRTPETRETPNFIGILLQPDEDEMLAVWSMDVHVFRFNQSIPYVNILRKWSRFCISYDFEENQAQVLSDERN